MFFFTSIIIIYSYCIIFLFLDENMLWYYWGASNEYPQHMFSWRNKKNIYLISPLIWGFAGVGGWVHNLLGERYLSNDYVTMWLYVCSYLLFLFIQVGNLLFVIFLYCCK